MRTEIQLIVTPEQAAKENLLKDAISDFIGVNSKEINHFRIIRKSIDARVRPPKINLAIQVFMGDSFPETDKVELNYQNVSNSTAIIIVGTGPAGLFAALKMLENGVKPIVIERGKDARSRKIDIALLNRNQGINPESNYCFGEGGAGTFSDGKLYTRSKKKGNVQRIFEIFHYHGANENILYEAHPHIGSDNLPLIVENMRKTILEHGGEVHFEEKLTELIIENDRIKGCKTALGNEYRADALILATGHSTHDVYEMLNNQGVELETKGFAMGVRVEHSQELINSIQYHSKEKNEYLPSASYSLVAQAQERGVYSFCMCPGGHIVPAGTNTESVVVNGMSASRRNSPYANSGIVVEIRPEDIPAEFEQYGVMKGLRFQQHVENLAYLNNGGKGVVAPAQRLNDFVKGKLSADLPECSYLPGTVSSPLHFWLPQIIATKLRDAFKQFNRKMPGYLTNDAIVLGVESRSSSPLRIPRDRDTMQHIRIKGLYPAGEGSGYSGGITSSAIDGENAALCAIDYILNKK